MRGGEKGGQRGEEVEQIKVQGRVVKGQQKRCCWKDWGGGGGKEVSCGLEILNALLVFFAGGAEAT